MAGGRFYALDALRGLAIALMILVNTPGSWQHVYQPLLHAQWDGFTFADIVFPAFLFVVGAAMFYALRRVKPDTPTLLRIAKRSALLVCIGILLNWFPFTTNLAELRLPGVLQRIGLCYGIAAVLVLVVKRQHLPMVAAALLVLYWLLLQQGAEQPFSLQYNVVRQLDLYLPINKALWSGSYVLLAGGLLFWLLAALLWLSDVKGQCRLLQPLVTYGTNPLFIYILSWLWAVVLGLIPVGDSNLYQALFALLAQYLPAKLASLLFALGHVALFWWVSLLLYRRNIIIRL